MIKALVFDFDGTLVESNEIKRQAFFDVVNKYGNFSDVIEKVFNEEADGDRRSIISRIISEIRMVSRAFDTFPQEQLASTLASEYTEICHKTISVCPYVEGAIELLEYLRQNGFLLFVNSATPESNLIDVIKARSLESFFKGVYGKPVSKTENLQRIIEENNLRPEEIVFVGDNASDLAAAEEIGCKFIGIKMHAGKEETKPDNSVDNLADLKKVIWKL